MLQLRSLLTILGNLCRDLANLTHSSHGESLNLLLPGSVGQDGNPYSDLHLQPQTYEKRAALVTNKSFYGNY
jgi:hypothetical protein